MNALSVEPSAAVLHEIRTPLGFLVTAARAAAEECPDDTLAQAHVRTLERAALRLLASAEQILAVARAGLDDTDQPFQPDEVAAEAIEAAVSIGQPVLLSRFGRADWAYERGNGSLLDAVIQSLLGNAINHGARGEPIRVTIHADSTSCVIEIRNRIGQRSRPGAGMGSGICSALVNRLQATLHSLQGDDDYVATLTIQRAPAFSAPEARSGGLVC